MLTAMNDAMCSRCRVTDPSVMSFINQLANQWWCERQARSDNSRPPGRRSNRTALETNSSPDLLQVVNFYKSDPGSIADTADNRRVLAGSQGGEDSAFPGVGWRQTIRYDQARVGVRRPIVVRRNQGSAAIVQFERRILQRVRHAGTAQARAESAHDHSRIAAVDGPNDEATDHYVVVSIDESA